MKWAWPYNRSGDMPRRLDRQGRRRRGKMPARPPAAYLIALQAQPLGFQTPAKFLFGRLEVAATVGKAALELAGVRLGCLQNLQLPRDRRR
jgi:hypothetical protein